MRSTLPGRTAAAARRTAARPGLPRVLILIPALLASAAGAWIWHRQASSQAGPAWDRPESAAEGRLRRAALGQPADAGAQAALGHYYLTAGRAFEALWAFQRARDAASESVGSKRKSGPGLGLDPRVGMADALASAGLPAPALDLLTEAAAEQPLDLRIALHRAELQLRLDQPAAALQTLRPFVSQPPNPGARPLTSGIALLRGRALEAAGDDAAALAQYRRGAAAAPSAAEPRLRLGRLLVRLGRLADGRAALAAAHRLAPADPAPCDALGQSFMQAVASNPLPAVRWFSAALRAAPGDAAAHLALARLCIDHRQWRDAARLLETVRSPGVREPAVLRGLAEILAATGHAPAASRRRGMADALEGQWPQALAEFRALQAAEPDTRDPPILISQVLIQMGRNAEAAVVIRTAAARWPRDLDLKVRLAELYLDSLTQDGARQLCEAWHRDDPAAAQPLWLLGRAERFSPRQLPQAIDHFERAARLAPRDPAILAALAEALARSSPEQNTSRALDLIGRALALAPGEAKYRSQLGLLLLQLNRPEAARRQLLRALDLNSGSTAALAGLIRVSSQLREPGQIALVAPILRDQQAARRGETALRRRTYAAPRDPAAYAALARWLAGRGELHPARAQWEVVLSLRPHDAEAQRELDRLDRSLAAL